MLRRFINSSSWLIFVGALLICPSAFGQQEFNFTVLTTKNGLSSNTVNVIIQDHNGLVWFGTNDGLNKFDGTNFTAYSHNERDSTSLPANEVVSLLEDRSGRLWVGTSGGKLVYYDQRHNAFIPYKGDGSIKKYMLNNARSLWEDHTGNIWMGSYGQFQIIDTHLGKVTTIDISQQATNDNLLVVLTFFEDSSHRIWIGTNGGLLLFNRESNKFTRFLHQDADPGSIRGDVVSSVAQASNGQLFFGTNNGLSMLMPNGRGFRSFGNEERSASISNDFVYFVTRVPGNKLWIGTEEGLNIFDCDKSAFLSVRPDRRKSFSLTNKSVRSICIAQKDIIWLGTYQGGVNKYDPNLALFNLKHSTPFDPKGLLSPVVTSFAEYKKDGIFIGTDGGGLHFFNRNSGLFDHLDIKSKTDHSGNPLSILALELDSEKKLWIGTYRHGLFLYDPLTRQYKQYLKGATTHDLNQNDIFCIKQDSKGLVWIGTNGCGINVLDTKTQTVLRYNTHPEHPGDLLLPLNGFMRAIAEDKKGDIWLGSAGTGIAVFHRRDRSFTLYNKSNSQLSDDGVLSILHDKSGNTWVGTYGGGLNLFNKKSEQFTHLTENDGLPNGIIYKILEDEAGIIWISTDKGISSINPKTKKIKNFSRSNGVQDSPFIFGAGITTSAGELFFGGQDGFNYFSPTSLPTNNGIPTVLFTDLKVANNTVIPGEDSPIQEQISTAKDIYLSYGQNFSVSYVALNYTAPQQNHYSYKLTGFDHDWNYVGKEKTAYYTNIDPGEYEFQVRANNNEGIWNNKTTTIRIHVLPPLWRTVYAYLLYAFLILGFLFYMRRRGIQKIKKQLALEHEKINTQQLITQQRQEAERVHELDLQKIKFLTNLSHEFRTPISLILAPVDKLLLLPKDAVIAGQVKMIRRNARRLLNLVNQLLDFRKMEEHELKLNLSPGDLIAFVAEAAESFQDLSERKKIALIVESDLNSLPAVFDHDKIERIIFNLLSNAFKFTREGGVIRLKISVKEGDARQPKTFRATISDTGIGIAPELHDRIFERFFMDNKATSILNQGSGIGLSITKEFVQLHGGEINVESEPGHGAVFLLTLPVIEATIPYSKDILKTEQPGNDSELLNDDIKQILTGFNANMPTILLVEDNEEFRYHLKDSLQASYHIIEAANGKDGWQKTLSGHPQLVVSDISMPYMNGIELSQKIKTDKRTSHIPVILLTAINGEEDQIKGLESGANDYLTKPFNFEILNAKIKNLLLYNRSVKDAYSKQIQVKGKEIEIESGDVKLLNLIVQYIDEKLNHPDLSVEDLSKHVNMSRGSLYHKLLQITGLTPIEYIRSIKLDRAAELLAKSNHNVAQVAYMTGFGTPSYFSRLFKSRFNVLPSEYMHSKRKVLQLNLVSC
jgi:signal transduction histidine kinase/ligand-binding sensor domain-containing protein/CheY-like chemotaxis protein/AraC-like DNA-binding protein